MTYLHDCVYLGGTFDIVIRFTLKSSLIQNDIFRCIGGICSHTVAVAEILGCLSPFLSSLVKKMNLLI